MVSAEPNQQWSLSCSWTLVASRVAREPLRNMTPVLAALLLLAATVAASSECSQQTLLECMSSLSQVSDHSEFAFDYGREELDSVCPSLSSSLLCVERYTQRCMSEEQRVHFRRLYPGVPTVFEDLCKEGPYQTEFLSHSPCMRKASKGLEYCAGIYQHRLQEVQESVNVTAKDFVALGEYQNRKVCYFLQEYLHCSSSIVRDKCGEATAQFAHTFLETMSSPVRKMHCDGYTVDLISQKGGAAAAAAVSLLPLMPLLMAALTVR